MAPDGHFGVFAGVGILFGHSLVPIVQLGL